MTNKKTTKRALLASVLSVLMCFSMLVGSTFAWFTDTAATSVNTIQAGNLKIAFMVQDSTAAEGWTNAEDYGELSFANVKGETDILWEPGATFNLPAVKLVNNGDLALKYKLLVNGVTGDTELANVLEVVVNGENTGVTLADFMADPDGVAYGIILPAGAEKDTAAPAEELAITVIGGTDATTVGLHMMETAGNEYQGLSLSGMTFTAFATQYTYEYDSEDNQYDEGADYIMYENILTSDQVATLEKSDSKIEVEDAYISGEVDFINTFANGTDAWTNDGETSTFKDSEIAVRVTAPLPVATNYAVAIIAANYSTFENVVAKNSTYIGEGTVDTVYDLLAFQKQTTNLIGGEYGQVAVQPNGAMIVDGAKIDRVDTGARNNTYKAANDTVYGLGGGLFVKSGSDIGTIYASSVQGNSNVAKAATGGRLLKIVVEAGADIDEIILDTFDTTASTFIVSISAEANVGKIVLNNTEYTLTEWLASGYNDQLT